MLLLSFVIPLFHFANERLLPHGERPLPYSEGLLPCGERLLPHNEALITYTEVWLSHSELTHPHGGKAYLTNALMHPRCGILLPDIEAPPRNNEGLLPSELLTKTIIS